MRETAPPPPPPVSRRPAFPPPPPPPPPGKRKTGKKTSCARKAFGCLGLLIFSALAIVAIIRCAVWGTPFPDHGALFSQPQRQRDLDPALPRITDGESLRAALAGFFGETFHAYVAIDGLGDNVRVEIEMPVPADPAVTDEQIRVFEQVRTGYAGMKAEVMARLMAAYGAMRNDVLTHRPEKNPVRAGILLWIFGFPTFEGMFQPIKTPTDMERLWGDPTLEIPAEMHAGKLAVVLQDFPAWNPEDTFGVVLLDGKVFYAGSDPDFQWPDESGRSGAGVANEETK